MKKIDIITFRSAHDHLAKEGKSTRHGYVSFADMHVLFAKDQKPVNRQNWTYIGNNWDRSVRPYFNA